VILDVEISGDGDAKGLKEKLFKDQDEDK